MKILLDENLPHALRLELDGHDVFTATYMRWSGIKPLVPRILQALQFVKPNSVVDIP